MSSKAGKAVVCVMGGLLTGLAASGQSLPNLFPFPNASGLVETRNAGNGPIDLTGPFFQSLGTNGRFNIGLTPQEKSDLVAFLSAL
jgi:hypothetical protein